MRLENTIEENDWFYTLKFTDRNLFDLFIDYTKESIIYEMRNQDGTQSVYDYCILPNECDSKALTIPVNRHLLGMKNIIGKFFLETDLDLPKGIVDEYTDPRYKQPTVAIPKEEDYARGVPKIMLGRHYQGKATVSEYMIHRLQTVRDETVEAAIQMAYQKLIKENLYLAPVVWQIVFAYFTPKDNFDMLMTVSESKSSFFADQVPQQDIALLTDVLRSLIGKSSYNWQPLSKNIEIGIDKTSGRPAIAPYAKNIGFQIILDKNDKLIVRDKSQQYAVLDPFAAFEVIRKFAPLVQAVQKLDKQTSSKENSKNNCLVM